MTIENRENNEQNRPRTPGRIAQFDDRTFFALIENISDVIVATDLAGKVCTSVLQWNECWVTRDSRCFAEAFLTL